MPTRPESNEYAPFYAHYIGLVPGNDIVAAVEQQGKTASAYYSAIAENLGEHRYAPGKWTVKEVLQHILDTERIIGYRALRIARNDQTNLPPFEQDAYVPESFASQRSIADLAEEFTCVRRSSSLLLRSFAPETWSRMGRANNSDMSVRALAYALVGHEINHRQIFEERYLIAG